MPSLLLTAAVTVATEAEPINRLETMAAPHIKRIIEH